MAKPNSGVAITFKIVGGRVMSGKTALIIIDMQNDFMKMVAGALATVPRIKKLVAFSRQKGWTVIHLKRSHARSGVDAEKFRLPLFREGAGVCVEGTPGAEIVEELAPQPEDIVVIKTRFSGFLGTNLDMLLKRMGVERLIICGTQYPNCVRATATDAMCLDYDTVVCSDCSSAASEEVAKANIYDLEHMGIQCLSLEQVMAL